MANRLSLGGLFLFVLGCDQAGKHLAVTLPPGGRDVIPGFFRLVYAVNPGVAFSSFVGVSPTLLSLFGVIMVSLLCVALWRSPAQERFTRLGYVLILGGAVGNLTDRIRLGHVVDFILWHLGERFAWPVFNPADAAIVIGVGFLFLQSRARYLGDSHA